ncbi:hypothetical protein KKC97_06810 [bacterium]|nr:hypothetical protein [bacterium]MBU1637359.1 hypothetical protein [bacterium]MBU1919615.1 hypothetical protein [bacterium]
MAIKKRDTRKPILSGVLLLLTVGLLLAVETGTTPYTPPDQVRFNNPPFKGREMTLGEQLAVWKAIDSISTPPPDSIRWTDAAGSTKTVSCDSFADLLSEQMNSGRMETDVSGGGKDHGRSGVNHLSDGKATDKDQMNVDSSLLSWAAASDDSLVYLEETLIHEATHKGQKVSEMTTDEEEIEALEAELAYKDSCGLDLTNWYYLEKFCLLFGHMLHHTITKPFGGSLLHYSMNGYLGFLRHNPNGDGVDYLVTNGPTGTAVNEYDLNLYGIRHAADMVTFDNHFMLPPDHCLAVTCGGDPLTGTASINLLSIYQGQFMNPVWDYQFGPAQGYDPMFFYCMTSWDPTGKWYVIDSTGHQILIMVDSQQSDGVPDEITGVYASASWPGFEPLLDMKSIQATEHPELGFGIFVSDRDKGETDVVYPYDDFFFLPDTPARSDSADSCVPVKQYEFLSFNPDIQYPLPWDGDEFVHVWGSWESDIQVWTSDSIITTGIEFLGLVHMTDTVDAVCGLSRPLVAGEFIYAYDATLDLNLRLATKVVDPTPTEVTINFDSNDGMLKVYYGNGLKNCHYELWSSDDCIEFYNTGLTSTDGHFEFPLPPQEKQFYQVRAVR